ncbi:hypothetical protein KTH73_14230 [Acinetobacter courvalinii]|nr:hypothetical protein [Acinetobacter courvalinii]
MSKAIEYYPEALDHVARQSYGYANFGIGVEKGLDTVEGFYTDESKLKSHQQASDLTYVQHIRKGSTLGKFELHENKK